MKEKLKTFGNRTIGTSLYGKFQVKKTSPGFERAKLQGGSEKQTSGPIVILIKSQSHLQYPSGWLNCA